MMDPDDLFVCVLRVFISLLFTLKRVARKRISYLIRGNGAEMNCGEVKTNNKGERNNPVGNNNNARLEYLFFKKKKKTENS